MLMMVRQRRKGTAISMEWGDTSSRDFSVRPRFNNAKKFLDKNIRK
tara:strand:- start:557 stop:694 length:138 start_codon:yes stop_codon:yes gene_type:complete